MGYSNIMGITEIKTKVAELPELELADFARWFEEFQADAWGRQTAQKTRPRPDKTRLALECAKLDPAAEQEMSDEGLAAEVAQWPPY